MVRKTGNVPRSRIGSKCEIKKKKKKEELIYVFAFEVYGFLTIHVVTLLELEIYRAFIKLLDQTEKKAKKT